MVTPLIDKLRSQGGTLYTFSSAARDLNISFTNKDVKFSFSHFACLNLPDIMSIKDIPTIDNNSDTNVVSGLCLDALLSDDEFNNCHNDFNSDNVNVDNINISMFDSSENMNIALAENIQNYVMNFETYLLNIQKDTKYQLSASERIFFDWLQKVKAIRFKECDNGYIEDGTSVVQYIGTIDAINSVEILGDTFSEIYLYIPGESGKSNSDNGGVIFNSPTDGNSFINNHVYEYISIDGTEDFDNTENIIGRENIKDKKSPFELSLKAIYDNKVDRSYSTGNGYCIDFNPSTYGESIYGESYTTLTELNNESTESFEFNCVLIYYSLSKNNDTPVTNLYGVLFLEEIKDINFSLNGLSKQGYIQRYPKIKSSSDNGNSFALKIDLKIDTLPDRTTSKQYTDPNTVASMTMYMEAVAEMQKCISIFNKQENEIIKLQQRVNFLENQLYQFDKISNLSDRMDDVERSITMSEPTIGFIDYSKIEEIGTSDVLGNVIDTINRGGIVVDGVNVKDLILENSKNINDLVHGKLSTKLQFNTNVIQNGYGINVNKPIGNEYIEINNRYASYNIITLCQNKEMTSNSEITKNNRMSLNKGKNEYNNIYLHLSECSNLGVLYINDKYKCNSDINIYINTDDVKWKVGQSIKIMIDGNLISTRDYNNNNEAILPKINIYPYSGAINSISNNDYVKDNENAKCIEIICLNNEDNDFIYEISK